MSTLLLIARLAEWQSHGFALRFSAQVWRTGPFENYLRCDPLLAFDLPTVAPSDCFKTCQGEKTAFASLHWFSFPKCTFRAVDSIGKLRARIELDFTYKTRSEPAARRETAFDRRAKRVRSPKIRPCLLEKRPATRITDLR